MKSISEYRTNYKATELASSVKYLMKQEIDFNVFLPSYNINLQRDFVWDILQKREIIWSIIKQRHIPHISVINTYTNESSIDGVYEIIDGKQRLSSILGFVNNEFTLLVDDKEYLFSELPEEFQLEIKNYSLRLYIIYENRPGDVTDKMKVEWFTSINFAGTAQDVEYFDTLSKLVK